MKYHEQEDPIKNSGESDAGEADKLQEFISEMAEIKRQEEAKEIKSGHFLSIDPLNLTPEDMRIWRLYQKGTLTEDIFNSYRQPLAQDTDSSKFAEFVANKVTNWDYYKNRN